MKLGPLDFRQPSTWRGLLGLVSLVGWTLTPELRDQIALLLAAALSAIELFRDEYAARNASTGTAAPCPNPPSASAPTTGPNRAAAAAAERLRMSSHDAPTQRNNEFPPSGFGDR